MEDSYGIIPTNPIKANGIRSSKAILEHIITYDYQLISFKRVGSIKPINTNSIIDHYILVTRDDEIFNVYIDIYYEETIWIPPSGFKFLSSNIFYVDEYSTVQKIEVEKQYVIDNNCFNYLTIECLIKRISLN